MDDIVPTKGQQIALANEAKDRMQQRARSWLEDRTVKAVLSSFRPEDYEPRKAG